MGTTEGNQHHYTGLVSKLATRSQGHPADVNASVDSKCESDEGGKPFDEVPDGAGESSYFTNGLEEIKSKRLQIA